MDDGWLSAIAASPWVLPALFLLVVGDAFLVVLPSESLVVALAALWASTGHPPIAAVIVVAAIGAVTGDLACYLVGRRLPTGRMPRDTTFSRGISRAGARARASVLAQPAVLIFTARYIPFARIAVNLAAGASGLPLRRYLPLSAGAGFAWALYNCMGGSVFGRLLAEQPLLGAVIAVIVAMCVGFIVDRAVATRARGRSGRAEPAGDAE